jgi:IclR family KDG regulon transcriptional repressor
LPIMRVLTEQTGETSLLHIVHAGEALCIEKVESSQAVRVSYDVGSRGPLYAGGSGKSLLAFLQPNEIDAALARFDFRAYTEETPSDPFTLRQELLAAQRLGYAESSGEMDPGVSSVGVPVIDGAGTVQGSITVVCPSTRWSGTHRASCIGAALEAATAVRNQLTGSPVAAGVTA